MKIFFNLPKTKEVVKFQDGDNLPDEIDLPFFTYSDKWNTNKQSADFNYIYDIEDLVEPQKTRFIEEHSKGDEPDPEQIIKNTYLYDKKIEKRTDKDGEYKVVVGRLYSNNPKFIKDLKKDKYRGFSAEIEALNIDNLFINQNKQVYFKQAVMNYIACLKEAPPAVSSAGIINKLNFSKKDFGYEGIPKKVFFNNNNNNMDKEQFNQLLEAVNKQVETSVNAKFSDFEKKQQEAKQIKFSISKDITPEEAFKSLQAKFSALNNYELVEKKAGEEDGGGEENPKETAKFAEYSAKMQANKYVKKVGKSEKIDEPKAKSFTFETVNPNL